MNHRQFRPAAVTGTVVLATMLWFITFYLAWSNFWIKISFSAALLAAVSLVLQPDNRPGLKFNGRALILGLGSAVLLYAIFWAAKKMAPPLLPFADRQIGSIYQKGTGIPRWQIALLLFFVTGPAEELYWRGYLQKNLMERFGRWQGWLMATAVYAGVHIWSFNFMLIGAAAVAGAFWGALYWRLNNLAPVILSHSIWSTVIFALLPMH